jgi:hypothetical protein
MGLHVCGSWKIAKIKKIEKNNAMPIHKISSSLIWVVVFFLKKRYYYAFIIQKWKEHTFFEWNFIQKL